MTDGITFRRLLDRDIADIARIHRCACLRAYAFMGWDYSEAEVRAWYVEKSAEWDWGLVAETDGVVGFAAVAHTHLDQLFVTPQCQGRGIGTRLLKEVLRLSPRVMTLNVFERNLPARRFYERHGFRELRRFVNEETGAIELVLTRDVDHPSSPCM